MIPRDPYISNILVMLPQPGELECGPAMGCILVGFPVPLPQDKPEGSWNLPGLLLATPKKQMSWSGKGPEYAWVQILV